MDEVGTLANQNFLEWESRLKHIDEKMAKAHAAHARDPHPSDIQMQLSSIQKSRDELAAGVARARSLPSSELPNAAGHVHGLTASFATVGVELERVLATIVNSD